jgi:O-antigen/teichoic acid export membrane protein
VLTAARVGVLVAGGVSSILIGRFLGAREYGVFSTGVAISGLALLFGPMGVDQLQIFHGVELAEARRLIRRVGALTLLLVAGLAAGWPGVSPAARWCALAFGTANVGRLMLFPWLTDPQRRLEFRLRARRELMLTATTTACFVAAAAVTRDALTVCLAALVAHGVVLAASGSIRRTSTPVAGRTATLRKALPYALSSALYTVYFTLDSSILAAFRPDVEVGQYAAAYLPLTAISAVAIVVNSDILRSRLAAEYAGDLRQTSAGTFLRLSLGLGVLGSVGLAVVGPWAITLLFGDGFALATRIAPILAVTVIPHFVALWASSTLISVGRVRVVLQSQLALCGVNLAANLLFVDTYGAFAAAWATVGTEVLGAVVYCLLLARGRRTRPAT